MNKIVTEIVPEQKRILYEAYRSYWDGLCRYIFREFGSGPPAPEDVAQTAFMKFAALAEPGRVQNARAYLYATARNYVLDERRRQGDDESVDFERTAARIGLSDFTPEDVLLGREELRIFAEALERLPRRRRHLLLLNRLEDLTCEEIGRRMGMSGAAVQKQIERGLAECLRYMSAIKKRRRR